MGKIIGGLTLAGGAIIIRSLMTPQVNGPVLVTGIVILVVAVFLFIRELSRI